MVDVDSQTLPALSPGLPIGNKLASGTPTSNWASAFTCMKDHFGLHPTGHFIILQFWEGFAGNLSETSQDALSIFIYLYLDLDNPAHGLRISVMVQCNHCIMGLGCGYTGAAALVLGHYALLVAQIAQTVIVPATFQSLLDVCVYVSDPPPACTGAGMCWQRNDRALLSLQLRYGSDVIDFSFLSYHLALAKVCESFTSPIPPEFEARIGQTVDSTWFNTMLAGTISCRKQLQGMKGTQSKELRHPAIESPVSPHFSGWSMYSFYLSNPSLISWYFLWFLDVFGFSYCLLILLARSAGDRWSFARQRSNRLRMREALADSGSDRRWTRQDLARPKRCRIMMKHVTIKSMSNILYKTF